MQRTESKSWPSKSKRVVKAGMKTTGKDSPAAREPIVNRTRSTSEITKDKAGEVITPRKRDSSGKDFVTETKTNRSEYRAVWGLGYRRQHATACVYRELYGKIADRKKIL